MPNLPISGLTASASNAAATDVLPVVQTTGTGPVKMTVQQMAGGLLGSTTLSGATITADAPVLNMSQTWNNGAVTFTGLKFNATDTASAAASLLMDLQVGSASQFSVSKTGATQYKASGSVQVYAQGRVGGAFTLYSSGGIGLLDVQLAGTCVRNVGTYSFGSSSDASAGGDTYLTRRAAANLRLGAADAAAPVAQTLSVQSITGTNASAAAYPFKITGSQGTGNAAGGSIIFQVAPAGGSGAVQNTLVDALTIDSTRVVTIAANASSLAQIAMADRGTVLSIYATAFGVQPLLVSTSGGIAVDNKTGSFRLGASQDVRLERDAANTLALRNRANAQAFRVYNTTDGTNSESLNAYWAGNTAYLLTVGVGTGPSRNLVVGTAANNASLAFWTNAAERWSIGGSTGHLLAGTDNTYDIGASGASRPRVVYAGVIAATSNLRFTASTKMAAPSDGVLNLTDSAGTDFNRLQFGGTTSSFPALKRSSTTLQVRLADDSAFASVQGKLTTDTAYTATVIVPTGYLTLYDSTGTAYRVPCVV